MRRIRGGLRYPVLSSVRHFAYQLETFLVVPLQEWRYFHLGMGENLASVEHPAIVYLRDVLGVRTVPKSALGSSTSGLPVMRVDEDCDVTVQTFRPLNSEEKRLAEKMLAAIDCHKILWRQGRQIDFTSLTENQSRRGLIVFGNLEKPGGSDSSLGMVFLQLPDLAEFFGADSKVHDLKKSAWEKLKRFKQAIENEK